MEDNPIYDVVSYAKSAMAAFIDMKKHFCKSNNGRCDLQPMIHVVYDNDEPKDIVLPLPNGKHPVEGAKELIPAILLALRDKGHKTKIIMLILESYMASSFDPETYQQGSFQKDFQENPSSNVREALVVNGINLEENTQAISITPFGYDDYGMPSFEEQICEIVNDEQKKTSKLSSFLEDVSRLAKEINNVHN